MFSLRSANVLRHRDFRLLFIGQSISQIGSQAVVVAMALYITRRTGSATDLSVILGAEALALVICMVFGGVWADLLPRHMLVIASDLTRAGVHALLGVLIITGHPAIWLIAVIEVVYGAATAFFQPAYMGLVPQTVPEDEIQAAQALGGTVYSLAMVLGPLFATALVLTIGAGETFVLDAATFLFGAALLAGVKPRARGAGADPERQASFVDELRAGFRELTSRPWVWMTTITYTGVLVLAVVPLLAVSPIVIRHLYGEVGLYGVLIAIWGGGGLAASVAASFWHPRYPLRTALMFGIPYAFLGLAVALALPRGVLAVFAFASGMGGSFIGVWWDTTLAHHIPPASLSRVSAWDYMGSTALMPVGFIVVGPLASALGPRWVLGGGSALGAILAACALLPASVRTLPAQPVASGPLAADDAQPSRPSPDPLSDKHKFGDNGLST